MPVRITGMNSGLDTEAIIEALTTSYATKKDNYTKAQTKLSWKQDAWKSLNTKVYSLYTSVGNMRYSSSYSMKKTTVSDSTKATVTAGAGAINGTQTLKINKLAKSGFLTGAKLDDSVTAKTKLSELGVTSSEAEYEVTVGGETKKLTFNKNDTIEDVIDNLNEAGVTATFDEANHRIFINSKESGSAGDFTIKGTNDDGTAALKSLGLLEKAKDDDSEEEGAVKVKGVDGEIELNGAKFTSSNNIYNINNFTIQATQVSEEMTVTTSTDTQGLYDKIKNFLSEYNTVINEMSKLYNADSAKDYEPLTDDEKAEMSETEIEKWESKIKDSLLRRDSTLNSVMTAMTTAMMKTYEINGKTMALSTLGIHTLGTLNAAKNENYAYHIDGDSEDEKTSGNKEKLMKALAEDPDSVIDFMKKLSEDLYTQVGNKMKSTAVSSIYTIYNDKEMASEYSNYSDLIKTWTTRVTDLEDRYYKKFAAMESALAKLQNSTSSITGLMGGNQ